MMNYNECLLKAAIHHGAAMALVLGTREVIKDCTSNELAVISDCLAHGLNERGTYKVASHLSRHVHDIDINKVYNKVDQLIKIAKIVTDKTIEDELIKLAMLPEEGLGVMYRNLTPEQIEKMMQAISPPTGAGAAGGGAGAAGGGAGAAGKKEILARLKDIGQRILGYGRTGLDKIKGWWGNLGRAGRIGVGATAAAATLATLGYLLYRMFSGGGDAAASAVGPEAGAGPSPFGNLFGSITLPDIVGAGGLGLVLYDLLRKRKKAPGESSNVLADYWPTILGLAAAGLGFAPRIIGALK
jgi:hypothetical protein